MAVRNVAISDNNLLLAGKECEPMTPKKKRELLKIMIPDWQLNILVDALRDHELVQTRLHLHKPGNPYLSLVEGTRKNLLELLKP